MGILDLRGKLGAGTSELLRFDFSWWNGASFFIMKMSVLISLLLSWVWMMPLRADNHPAKLINQWGIDFYRQSGVGRDAENLLISPLSLYTALAMTYGGADGTTREEMAQGLNFGKNDAQELKELSGLLNEIISAPSPGKEKEGVTCQVANRLFAQQDLAIQPDFLTETTRLWKSPLESLNFQKAPQRSCSHINRYVADHTGQLIKELLPSGAITSDTRFVLVNALYFLGPWEYPMNKELTKEEPFYNQGKTPKKVPMMKSDGVMYGYLKGKNATIVSLPYQGSEFQMQIILPHSDKTLAEVEKLLTAEAMDEMKDLPKDELVVLKMPQMKLQPSSQEVTPSLRKMGLKQMFDETQANFQRITPRLPDQNLFVSSVYHQTYLSCDEEKTEAAAATGVGMAFAAAPPEKKKPILVSVDRPFLLVVQHRKSGVILMLGRVNQL
jgi:serpin B